MKLEYIELFQTIRAYLQPYATRGMVTAANSETEYELVFNAVKPKEAPDNFVHLTVGAGGVELTMLDGAGLKDMLKGNMAECVTRNGTLKLKHAGKQELKELEVLFNIAFTKAKENGLVA